MLTPTLFGRTLLTRAAPRRVQVIDPRPAAGVGDIIPETTAMGSATPTTPPAAAPPTGATNPAPFIPGVTPVPAPAPAMTLRTTLGWAGSLVGLASGAAFGLARGGVFPALGYGVLGTVVGTGAGYIVGNLVDHPTQNPIG